MTKNNKRNMRESTYYYDAEEVARYIVNDACTVVGDINADKAFVIGRWQGSGYSLDVFLITGEDDFYDATNKLAEYLFEHDKKGHLWDDVDAILDVFAANAEEAGLKPDTEEWYDYRDGEFDEHYIKIGEDLGYEMAVYSENMQYDSFGSADMEALRAELKKLGYKESKQTQRKHIKEAAFDKSDLDDLVAEILEGECPVVGDIYTDEAVYYKLWAGEGYYTYPFLVMDEDKFYDTADALADYLTKNHKQGTLWYSEADLFNQFADDATGEGYEPHSQAWIDFIQESIDVYYVALTSDVYVYAENFGTASLNEDDLDYVRAKLRAAGYKESTRRGARRSVKEASGIRAAVERLLRESDEAQPFDAEKLIATLKPRLVKSANSSLANRKLEYALEEWFSEREIEEIEKTFWRGAISTVFWIIRNEQKPEAYFSNGIFDEDKYVSDMVDNLEEELTQQISEYAVSDNSVIYPKWASAKMRKLDGEAGGLDTREGEIIIETLMGAFGEYRDVVISSIKYDLIVTLYHLRASLSVDDNFDLKK